MTHLVGIHNSSQFLNQLMNCVYERKEEGTYSLGHTDVFGPNQEAPGELIRKPHSLPSLFQMMTSMRLDVRSNGLACNGSCAQRESLEILPQMAHPSEQHTRF